MATGVCLARKITTLEREYMYTTVMGSYRPFGTKRLHWFTEVINLSKFAKTSARMR
jgi:hypothetical protein